METYYLNFIFAAQNNDAEWCWNWLGETNIGERTRCDGNDIKSYTFWIFEFCRRGFVDFQVRLVTATKVRSKVIKAFFLCN